MMKKNIFNTLMLLFVVSLSAQANVKKDTLIFTTVKENKITPVKNQGNSGTCWSFSGLGFFESELLRIGKPIADLSEMFVVSHSYKDKADKYVRTNGTINFAPGGSFYDVQYVWKHYGMVPNEVMTGLNYGEANHKHGELDALTESAVKGIVKNPNKTISPVWKTAFDGIVDAYLGSIPDKFIHNGKQYTPQSYAASLELNMDDYVSVTSFTHHPFYTTFAIEIPDNWRWGTSYNIPLNEFAEIFDYAINQGYTIAWGADVSEKGFTRNGIGVLPETKEGNLVGTDQAKWLAEQKTEKKFTITGPIQETKVTQETRQKGFDNYQTTDDHGMQIFGIAKDQTGKEYYMVKNSWGTNSKYKGIWYVSKTFVQEKTINILIHKDAIPQHIRTKMGI